LDHQAVRSDAPVRDRPSKLRNLAFVEEPAAEPTGVREQFRAIGRLIILTDALAIMVALIFGYLLRFSPSDLRIDYFLVLAVAPVTWIAVFRIFGLHTPHLMSRAEEFRRIVGAVGVGVVLIILASFGTKADFSRLWVALSLAFALSFELLIRWTWRHWIRSQNKSGKLMFRTLIVGNHDEATKLQGILQSPGSGFDAAGYVEIDAQETVVGGFPGSNLVDEMRSAIVTHGADCVFIASPTLGPNVLLAVAQAARQTNVELRLYTHMVGVLSTRLHVLPVGSGGLAISFKPAHLTRFQRTLKRLFDVTLASVLVVLFSPLLAIVSVLIKTSSPGPIFFRQPRVTREGRIFNMHKFRTMDARSDRLVNPDFTTPFFKIKDDPRLTKVGRFLRTWSIDELPQLLDVILGDMSLVGPRPLPEEQVTRNKVLLAPRHEVKAGMTGWWQINGRSEVDVQEALRMDMFYIENWSLALDLYILLRTLWVTIKRWGAY
jgi:exopolysaccharide biosynthesis polyprenyl glycosylphosphotransferase